MTWFYARCCTCCFMTTHFNEKKCKEIFTLNTWHPIQLGMLLESILWLRKIRQIFFRSPLLGNIISFTDIICKNSLTYLNESLLVSDVLIKIKLWSTEGHLIKCLCSHPGFMNHIYRKDLSWMDNILFLDFT